MLKITQEQPHQDHRLLRLEGRLVGPWVEEVARLCQEELESRQRLTLDMSGVSYTDAGGTALLWRLTGEKNVVIENCTAFVYEQLRGDRPID